MTTAAHGLGGSHLGALIKARNPGKSLRQIADAAGIAEDNLRRWLRKDRAPGVPNIPICEKIGQWIHATTDEVFEALAQDIGMLRAPGISEEEWMLIQNYRRLSRRDQHILGTRIVPGMLETPPELPAVTK